MYSVVFFPLFTVTLMHLVIQIKMVFDRPLVAFKLYGLVDIFGVKYKANVILEWLLHK